MQIVPTNKYSTGRDTNGAMILTEDGEVLCKKWDKPKESSNVHEPIETETPRSIAEL